MDFSFQNKEYFQVSSRKDVLFEEKIKKIFIFTSITLGLCFLFLKALWFYNHSSFSSHFQKKPKLSKEKRQEQTAHILPLLLNLKGEKGPQLFKVQVSITLSQNSLKKEFLSQNKDFEKHLLFILSGQEIKTLQNNKHDLEQQIRSQLNAFLSQAVVDGVQIQAEKFN